MTQSERENKLILLGSLRSSKRYQVIFLFLIGLSIVFGDFSWFSMIMLIVVAFFWQAYIWAEEKLTNGLWPNGRPG